MMGRAREESFKKNRPEAPPKEMEKLDRLQNRNNCPAGKVLLEDKRSRGRANLGLNVVIEQKLGQRIAWIPSRHFDARTEIIDAVVLHYTATGCLEEAIDLMLTGENAVSAHFVIGRDGRIVQMVDIAKKAWHAGESEFDGRSDVNDFSVGIELVNWGVLKERDGGFFAWPDDYGTKYTGAMPVYAGGQWWDPFMEEQYRVLAELIRQIRVYYPAVTPGRIIGHQDIARPTGRKIDPGEAFDWGRVRRAFSDGDVRKG
jgi:N-acetyl-anhydromuramyl-L-alanine amidase AmpD